MDRERAKRDISTALRDSDANDENVAREIIGKVPTNHVLLVKHIRTTGKACEKGNDKDMTRHPEISAPNRHKVSVKFMIVLKCCQACSESSLSM